MSTVLPFSLLRIHPERELIALICGSSFQIINSRTGSFIATKKTPRVAHLDNSSNGIVYLQNTPAEATIRTAAFDPSGKSFVTSDDSKLMRIWNTQSWECLHEWSLVKKANAVCFTEEGDILVGDKSGDVYKFDVRNAEEKGKLLLGHVSILTDMEVSPDEKYIITSDRDEKIRVSEYPKSYNIHNYCLAHEEYVSCIHKLKFDSWKLISGGGDRFLYLWDYLAGNVLQKLSLYDLLFGEDKNKISCLQSCMDENESPQNKINVTTLTSSVDLQMIAVCVERVHGILFFRWEETNQVLTNPFTLPLQTCPLSCEFDVDQRLWVILDGQNSEKDLLKCFSFVNDKWEENSDITKTINQFGSVQVDILPDLYPTSQMRKDRDGFEKNIKNAEGEEQERKKPKLE